MSASVPLLNDSDPFEDEDPQKPNQDLRNRFIHPYIVFFHFIFRGTALIAYFLCGWFSSSYISSFVIIVLLLSSDFWVVKNITGRILVGLRWWNFVDDEGKSQWIYESKAREGNRASGQPEEVKVFWLGLVLSPVIWGLMLISAVFFFQFKWLLIVLIALTLNCANLHGYVKCHFGAGKDIKSATQDMVKGALLKNAMSSLFSSPNANPSRNPNIVV